MTIDAAAGWYPVGHSGDLPAGGVEPIEHFGREMVLYRGDDGIARVLDAHCRHLGAHLGYGGHVEGSSIRCPFHAWRWTAAGTCDDVPYASKVPPGARIRSWPTAEANGLVFLWYAPAGEPPDRDLPAIDVAGGRGVPEIRRWIEKARIPPPDGVERRSFGPGFFVDRRRDRDEIVRCGGWTPVDGRRGHLRTVTFVGADGAEGSRR